MTLQEYFDEYSYSIFPSFIRIYNGEHELIGRGELVVSKKDCIKILPHIGNFTEIPLSLACEVQRDGRIRAILNDEKVLLHFVF